MPATPVPQCELLPEFRPLLRSVAALAAILVVAGGCAEESVVPAGVALFVELPDAYHTPNGGDVAPDGTIIFTVPNSMNNRGLVRNGLIEEPMPSLIAAIDDEHRVSTWYSFSEEDRAQGGILPMDGEFGPDGHFYITDMAGSRVIRINVADGRAVDADVVVQGIGMANGLTWKDDLLFVTASRLHRSDEAEEDGPLLISGVYAFALGELGADDPIALRPYGERPGDKHLFVTFESSNKWGIGADGVAIGSGGHLYTAIFEDGTIYRTTLDADNRLVETVVHAADERIVSADGIAFSPTDNRVYVADIMANALHAVDLDGNVTVVHQNEDTSGEGGELDAPGAVVVRGSQVIVMNWDGVHPALRNSATDRPFTVSVFDLN